MACADAATGGGALVLETTMLSLGRAGAWRGTLFGSGRCSTALWGCFRALTAVLNVNVTLKGH